MPKTKLTLDDLMVETITSSDASALDIAYAQSAPSNGPCTDISDCDPSCKVPIGDSTFCARNQCWT